MYDMTVPVILCALSSDQLVEQKSTIFPLSNQFTAVYCSYPQVIPISLEHLVYYVGILRVKHYKSCNFFACLTIFVPIYCK